MFVTVTKIKSEHKDCSGVGEIKECLPKVLQVQ